MPLVLDYPSQRYGVRCPPAPMLLDTCAVQHLYSVTAMFEDESGLDDEAANLLLRRFGTRLGPELVALADLVTFFQGDRPPWIVSETSLVELGRAGGERGLNLQQWWWDWRHYWDEEGWSERPYPEIDHDGLMWPRIIVHPNQLALFEAPSKMPHQMTRGEPFDTFAHAGDRALASDAARAGVRGILTTDIRSFWTKRRALYGYGVEVWRPTDVWRCYGGEPVGTPSD